MCQNQNSRVFLRLEELGSKPACGCEEAPIFFKESKPVLEVLFRRKNPTALVWFGAVNLYKIHNCLHKTPRAMT
jgi:hypothetical protein